MSNQYATVPALIVGNVTITGNLTIGGDTIVLGSSPRKTRIQNAASQAFLSHNWDRLALTSDAGGTASQGIQFFDTGPSWQIENAAAGAPAAVADTMRGDTTENFAKRDIFRIGAALPFIRLFKDTIPNMQLSYNLGSDLATRDDGATAALMLGTQRPELKYATRYITPAGTVNDSALAHNLSQSNLQVIITGTTAETIAYSRVIPGNSLGIHGGFFFFSRVIGGPQGGVATTFRVKLGATLLASWTHAAVDSFMVFGHLSNRAATNIQDSEWVVHTGVNTLKFSGVGGAGIDTTLDQTLFFTIQPGAVGDRWDKLAAAVYAFGGSANLT